MLTKTKLKETINDRRLWYERVTDRRVDRLLWLVFIEEARRSKGR